MFDVTGLFYAFKCYTVKQLVVGDDNSTSGVSFHRLLVKDPVLLIKKVSFEPLKNVPNRTPRLRLTRL